MILDHVTDRVDAAVHRTERAKVRHLREMTLLRSLHGSVHQLLHTLVFHCADRHHRDAQRLRQRLDVHRAAVAAHLVHHVQRQHHRRLQLHELQRQIQVTLDVRRVDDVDNAVRLFVQNEVARNDLLIRIRAKRIDARQVHNGAVLVRARRAGFALDCDAGEIADVLVRAGELVEKRRLAAVLIADQSKDHASTSTSICCASDLRIVSV